MKNLQLFFVLLTTLTLGVTNAWAEEVSIDFSQKGYSNQQAITDVTITEGINAKFEKGSNSNPPKYYTSGTAIRAYGGNTFTISSTIGNITQIDLTFGSSDGSNAITTDAGNFSSPKWTGDANSVKFTIGGTSGNRRIKAIKVTYTPNSGGETPDPTTYTIKWHTDKGVTTDVTLNEGATITKPATDPTMTGYEFMGWTEDCEVASDGAGFSAIENFGTATEDKDYYAVFAVATTTGGGGETATTGSVTMKYSGTTTSNMTEGNNAATVGLDANEWSVIPTKGSASNMPGLNKDGDIRLYGHASGGNYLTISSESYTITSVEITYTSNSYNNGKFYVNGTETTASNINANEFVIKNANSGTTQVRIKTLVINYTSISGGGTTTYDNYITTCASGVEYIELGDDFKWSAVEAEVTIDATDNVFPTLTNTHNVPVSYSSSDETIATIAADGTVTLNKEGTVTITAKYAGGTSAGTDKEYKAKTVTYSLKVNKAAPQPSGTTYVKVTSTAGLTDGEYLIVYEDASNATPAPVAFDGSLPTLDAASNNIAVTISNNTIAGTNYIDLSTFTIDATAKTVKSKSGYYIGQTSDANGLKANSSTKYENALSIENDGTATIKSGGAYLRYNSATNNWRFRYYKSSSYTGQEAIALYKKASEQTITIATCENGSVSASVENGATALSGTTITLNNTPATGYKLSAYDVYKTDDPDTKVTVTDNKFIMPEFDITISATFESIQLATLILSENGETHDLDGEHRLYEIVTLPNTAAACTKTFVGWSADANCTTAPEYDPGASYTLSELTQTLYAVYATANGAETKYIKLTTTPSPSFAGTYLIVNEENKVAFNGGLETLDATGNTISVEITDATIPSDATTENSTFTIVKNQGENNYFITSKSGKYIGITTTDANELDESTETEYTNTISIDADGNANIIGSGGAYLRYNATSGQERFRYYKSSTYADQKAIALYKKYSIPLYTNYTTYCGDDITISSGITQTFNTDQQINTLIIEGGATANLVAGNIEINTIILKGGLNADATDYKMPILYTNDATIDVDHLYLNLAINHNTYYPFAVPFPVSVSDIDYANPTLAAASEYGTHYLIKRYDGVKRAEEGVNKDVNWVVVATDETLQPGVGYIISALTGKSETTTTIQIPLTFEPEQNSTLNITAHTGTAAANDPIQKGWNFIAHPYLSKYAGNNINNAPRYVSIPTYNFSAYQQTMLMATTLSPEYPFFVQIGEDTEINFTTEGRRQTPASVRADENNQILNLLFKILLADEEKDQTGIILDNNCTPAYEIDADLEKMFGSEFTTSIYTLCQDKRLAFNAMSFENAQSSPIPLGYRAAEAGEYTINLDIIEDASAYENLYEGIVLYDSATESQTNLLYADYTFTTDKIQDDTRFSIQFVPKNNAPTHIENIPHYQITQKIMLNNQLYIIHNGQIYNITGQNIR